MARAWGDAWGVSWGVSWGTAGEPVESTQHQGSGFAGATPAPRKSPEKRDRKRPERRPPDRRKRPPRQREPERPAAVATPEPAKAAQPLHLDELRVALGLDQGVVDAAARALAEAKRREDEALAILLLTAT